MGRDVRRVDDGFTLIELLVALALLLLLLAMFSGSLVVAQRSAARQLDQGQTLNQLRAALSTLDAEVRSGFVARIGSGNREATIYTEARGYPECVVWSVDASPPHAGYGGDSLWRESWPVGEAHTTVHVAGGVRNGELGLPSGVFSSLVTPFPLANSQSIPVGTSLGVQLWISMSLGPLSSVNAATEVVSTFSARNAGVASLNSPMGGVIAGVC